MFKKFIAVFLVVAMMFALILSSGFAYEYIQSNIFEAEYLDIASTFRAKPDKFDENGTAIFYIDVSPEEWERTYLYHPYFSNRQARMLYENVSFVLRDTSEVSPRFARCPSCGNNSVRELRMWENVNVSGRTCPSDRASSDVRVAYTWRIYNRCNLVSCNWISQPDWDTRRINWSWHMECFLAEPFFGRPIPIRVGSSLTNATSIHNAFSIGHTESFVHGHTMSSFSCANGANCDLRRNCIDWHR
ncbi:MAG: hypothetical protein FWE29_05605 [Defluviitaleaceae bacterium]|nr:hypothetical protein [Defluviitaleaceae bacterium]